MLATLWLVLLPQAPPVSPVPPVPAPAAAVSARATGEEVVELWEDGTVRARFEVDERGLRDGPYRSFHRNGKRAVHAIYKHGQRTGTYQEFPYPFCCPFHLMIRRYIYIYSNMDHDML